jgi:Sulfotransferase family
MTATDWTRRITRAFAGARPERADGPVLVFIHVPKAGGQSFRSLIEANYPKAAWMPIYRTGGTTLAEVFAKAPAERIDRKRVVYGHIPHAVEPLIGRSCRYFTILREPVSRSISVYKFIKYDFESHPRHRRFATRKESFSEFCRNPGTHANIMTKLISGHEPRSTPDEAMLETAIANLRAMPVVGLFERYDESVARICQTFGWSMTIETRNVSSRSNAEFLAGEDAAEGALDALRDANTFDIRLYCEAERLFESWSGPT